MKKHHFLFLAVFGCSVLFTSCHDEYDNGGPLPPSDNSLAGSVSFYDRFIEAEGIYDNVPLENLTSESYLAISKKTDTTINMSFGGFWDNHTIRLTIPDIPLSGNPYDISINYVSSDIALIHNDSEFSVHVSLSGWIRGSDSPYRCNNTVIPLLSPVPRVYDFDISVTSHSENKPFFIRIKNSPKYAKGVSKF